MRIRPALPEDAPALAAVEAVAADHPWSEAQVLSTLTAAHGHGWLAFEGDEVVGHLLGQIALDEAELLSVAGVPSARRGGSGRALLRAAHEAWRALGATTAFLEVRADNAGAIALYEGDRWVKCGRRRVYDAQGTVDAVLMRIDLDDH